MAGDTNCPDCGFRNPDGFNFCSSCGVPLTVRCPDCGFTGNHRDSSFCGSCGARLDRLQDRRSTGSNERPRGTGGERRQLTVLFCDIVGSTEFSAVCDPEDTEEIYRAFRRICETAAHRYGTAVARYYGDGAMIFAGYPTAAEDDAERAAATALEIVEKASALRLPLGGNMRIRAGIATGVVVVGDRIETSLSVESAIAGGVPNLAARLQGAAEPGTVFLSSSTHRLLGDLFRCTWLGEHRLKGFEKPVEMWRLDGHGGVVSRFEALRQSRRDTFVGRDSELRLLQERWSEAYAGEGRVILVTGGPGIGKSRLVEQMVGTIEEAHLCPRFFCSPQHQRTFLFPVVRQLEAAAGLSRSDEPATKLDKLTHLLARVDPEGATVAPLFAKLLSIDAGTPEGTAEDFKPRLFDGFYRQVRGLAQDRPLLIFFEDLHWADPTTIELLQYIVESIRDLPILLVCTSRPEISDPFESIAHASVIKLAPLARGQAMQVIESAAGTASMSPDLRERIAARAEGIPLFLEELTLSALDHLDEDPSSYNGTTDIPLTLRDSLMARLDRLNTAKLVAQNAAVIGKQAPLSLLQEITDLGPGALDDALSRLDGSEILFRLGHGTSTTVQFKHALIRDAAYDSLLRSRRREIHSRIAETLERGSVTIDKGEPETVAYHFEAAQDYGRALRYWEVAGQRARECSANRESASHFSRAISLAKRVANSDEEVELELRLRLDLGGQLIALHGNGAPEVGENYTIAQELCERIGDQRLLFKALHGLRTFYIVRGPLQRAIELGATLLSLAETLGDQDLLIQAHRPHGLSLFYLGDLRSARVHLETAISLYVPVRHAAQRFEYISDPRVLAECNLGWTLCLLGETDRALDHVREAISYAETLDHKHSLAFALSFATCVRQALQDIGQVDQLATRLIDLSYAQRFPYWRAWGEIMRGWAKGRSDQHASGLEDVEKGLDHYRRTGANLMLPYFLTLRGEIELNAGMPDLAWESLEEAGDLMEATGTRFYEAETLRIRGLLCDSSATRSDEARRLLMEAIEVANRQGCLLLKNRAETSLADGQN